MGQLSKYRHDDPTVWTYPWALGDNKYQKIDEVISLQWDHSYVLLYKFKMQKSIFKTCSDGCEFFFIQPLEPLYFLLANTLIPQFFSEVYSFQVSIFKFPKYFFH